MSMILCRSVRRTRLTRVLLVGVAAASLAVGLLASSTTPASAATDAHLKITGPEVKGESPVKGFE